MKSIKLTTLAVLALFITLSSFSLSSTGLFGGKKDLIGKWTPVKAVMGDDVENFDPNDGKERSIEFLEDGKYKKDSKDEGAGTWSLNEKGDKLTLTGGRFAGEWTIIELSKEKLTMSMEMGGKKGTLYMIPYKGNQKKD